jgi:hypothetical protein
MRWLDVLTAALLAATVAAAEGKAPRSRFSKDEVGKLPAGWKAAQAGKGAGSVWKVVADRTAPCGTGLVLAQTAAGPSDLFNLCVAEDARYNDVEARVALKAVRGQKGQGGGILWRYPDPRNYDVARLNPLGDNYRVSKVVAGKRIQPDTPPEPEPCANQSVPTRG